MRCAKLTLGVLRRSSISPGSAALQLIHIFDVKTSFYLVYEKANGGSLLTHIQEQNTFSEKEAREIIRDILSALIFLHRKVLHIEISNWETFFDREENCYACKGKVFNNILKDTYDFPEEKWSFKLNESKDIIKNLLINNASRRLAAGIFFIIPGYAELPLYKYFKLELLLMSLKKFTHEC
ncbi:Putative protein kinase C delta type homolog [Gryllus bimaculatus]|nr:Putative protein kinase C delta type homolog [Gryllus bimaculatus]